MKNRIYNNVNITTGTDTPKTGIFWVINGELTDIGESIDINYDPLADEDVLHIDAWNTIKTGYKVNGRTVRYDYFPRGRVMIFPIRDEKGNFLYYDCDVYGDECIIQDPDVREMIGDRFRLYLPECNVTYKGQLSVDGTHYTCHNCR